MNTKDQALGDALAKALRQSESVDEITRARLVAARARALDTDRAGTWKWLGAAGALATLLLLALWMPQLAVPVHGNPPDAEMLEMLASENGALDPAMVEDLELLTWMDEPEDSA